MFIRVLLVFIVIYLVVKLIQSFSRSGTYQSTGSKQYSGRKEGEVSVDLNNSRTEKKISKTDGEYIDYEEL